MWIEHIRTHDILHTVSDVLSCSLSPIPTNSSNVTLGIFVRVCVHEHSFGTVCKRPLASIALHYVPSLKSLQRNLTMPLGDHKDCIERISTEREKIRTVEHYEGRVSGLILRPHTRARVFRVNLVTSTVRVLCVCVCVCFSRERVGGVLSQQGGP